MQIYNCLSPLLVRYSYDYVGCAKTKGKRTKETFLLNPTRKEAHQWRFFYQVYFHNRLKMGVTSSGSVPYFRPQLEKVRNRKESEILTSSTTSNLLTMLHERWESQPPHRIPYPDAVLHQQNHWCHTTATVRVWQTFTMSWLPMLPAFPQAWVE